MCENRWKGARMGPEVAVKEKWSDSKLELNMEPTSVC